MFKTSKAALLFAIVLALGGCESISDIPPSRSVLHPQPVKKEAKSASRKPSTWEDGIAKYYDTDGNGLADRWVRDGWEYVDTNHDGIPDRADNLRRTEPYRKMDTDFDGWFDKQVEGIEGARPDLSEREIHKWVPRFPHNKVPED